MESGSPLGSGDEGARMDQRLRWAGRKSDFDDSMGRAAVPGAGGESPRGALLARGWARFREWWHCRLGLFHLGRGSFARAKDHFLAASTLHPSSFVAHLNLGRIYLGTHSISII